MPAHVGEDNGDAFFESSMVGSHVPAKYTPACGQGLRERMQEEQIGLADEAAHSVDLSESVFVGGIYEGDPYGHGVRSWSWH